MGGMKNRLEIPAAIPARHSLAPFWFWNDLVEDGETERQMGLMQEAGVRQCIIHARGGLVNEYLSEDWFARVGHCVAVAKRLGMKLWLYDEKGWPSGNLDHTLTKDEAMRERHLSIRRDEIPAGDRFELERTGGLLNATAYPGETDLLGTSRNGRVELCPSQMAEVYTVNVRTNSYEPFGKYCIDYMNEDAIRLFIESTHEAYARHFGDEFGKTIVGMYMDETRFFSALPWTGVFAEEFRRRKGYDIVPKLHLLERAGPGSEQVRRDYWDTAADLAGRATYKQLHDWCEGHGLLLTGHFLGEETLASQSRFNGDIMRQYKHFHIPGIDHLGNGTGSLDAKICSCAAQNYGRGMVSCEAFGAAGWDMGFEPMAKISNWLFQQGVNFLIPHAFYYSIRGERAEDWPPSYFFQWEHWGRYKAYADMAARMGYVLSGGFPEIDLLVYYPVESFWGCFQPDFKEQTCYWKQGPYIRDGRAERLDRHFQTLCSELLDNNLDFGLLNADAAGNFEARDGRLVNVLTGAGCDALALVWTEYMPEEALSLIAAFEAQGGMVVRLGEDDGARECAEAVARRAAPHYRITKGCRRLRRTQTHYPGRLHDPYMHDGEQQYGIGVTRYVKDGFRIVNVTNYNDTDEEITIQVESAETPEAFFPETGERHSAGRLCGQNGDGSCVLGQNGDGSCVLWHELDLAIPQNRAVFILCSL